MKRNRKYLVRLLLTFAVVFAVVLLVQLRASSGRDSAAPVHMPVDWSYRHLIYSGPPTGPHAWEAMQDPRYQRHLSIYAKHERKDEESWGSGDWFDRRWHWPFHRREESPLKRDWQVPMGANALTGNVTGDFSFPAKFTFDINATPSCTNDFVVFTTGLPGATAGQASIMAINELYSGSGGFCGTGPPSVMWAYNTNLAGDNAGVIYSSPALSIDGSKVAFVETGNGSAILKILKWVSSQGTATDAVAPTHINTGNPWSMCPATGTSCLFSIAFSGGAADTLSSPFYNFNNDTLYVGDDNGLLHKFTGVFNGTPAEVVTGGWPFSISGGQMLTGPVYDAVSGNIFVADNFVRLYYVRETGSSVGTCGSGSPPCIGTPNLVVTDPGEPGVYDPPTVDQTTQRVFVYSSFDLDDDQAAVFQATTALGSSVEATLQAGQDFMFSGAFDKNYHAGSYASGFLYVCGTDPTTLYRIGFNSSGVMSSSLDPHNVNLETGEDLGSSCTPITEIVNGVNDYLFFGMVQDGAATGCTNGCLLGLNLTGQTWSSTTVSTFSVLPVAGGPSAIVVDNVGAAGQESSVYFGPQANNCTSPTTDGCAVKATQNGLN